MIYLKIYFTLCFVLILIGFFSFLLMDSDYKRRNPKQIVDYKQIEAVKKAAEERARQLMAESVMNLLPNAEEIEAWAKEQSTMEPTGAEEFGRKYGALWMRDLIEQHLKNDLKFVTPMYEITVSNGKTFTSAKFEELRKYTDGIEGMLEHKLRKKTKKK